MIDRDLIVQDIFQSYGVVIGVDDPVILAALTHEASLRQATMQVQTVIEAGIAEMDVVSARFTKQCETIADQLISKAIGKVKTQVETSMQGEIALGIEKIESAMAPMAEYVERAEKLKNMMTYLAIVTGFTAASGVVLMYAQILG